VATVERFGEVKQILEQPKVDSSGVASHYRRRVGRLRAKLQGAKREICSTKIKLAFWQENRVEKQKEKLR
jgi:hypothetical protein